MKRKIGKNLVGVVRLFRSIGKGYMKDDCYTMSAVISFYAIFSIIPITMIVVSLIAYFLGSSTEFLERMQLMVSSFLPQVSEDIMKTIYTAIEKKQQVSLISAGILVVIASLLVTALERALDRVFRTEKKRNFLHSRILAIGCIFLFILLFTVPGLLGFVEHYLERVPFLKSLLELTLSGEVLFFSFAFVAFLLSVMVIPHHKVSFRYTLIGATVFTLMTGLARFMFRYYIEASWSRYDLIYGSLKVLIVVMIWVFYLANIYLLSAELVARLQERTRKKKSV